MNFNVIQQKLSQMESNGLTPLQWEMNEIVFDKFARYINEWLWEGQWRENPSILGLPVVINNALKDSEIDLVGEKDDKFKFSES